MLRHLKTIDEIRGDMEIIAVKTIPGCTAQYLELLSDSKYLNRSLFIIK
jgi:hypothetical protein